MVPVSQMNICQYDVLISIHTVFISILVLSCSYCTHCIHTQISCILEIGSIIYEYPMIPVQYYPPQHTYGADDQSWLHKTHHTTTKIFSESNCNCHHRMQLLLSSLFWIKNRVIIKVIGMGTIPAREWVRTSCFTNTCLMLACQSPVHVLIIVVSCCK